MYTWGKCIYCTLGKNGKITEAGSSSYCRKGGQLYYSFPILSLLVALKSCHCIIITVEFKLILSTWYISSWWLPELFLWMIIPKYLSLVIPINYIIEMGGSHVHLKITQNPFVEPKGYDTCSFVSTILKGKS